MIDLSSYPNFRRDIESKQTNVYPVVIIDNNIFISIIDFKNENYDKLYMNRNEFSRYMHINPHLKKKKHVAKHSNYKIFLREL